MKNVFLVFLLVTQVFVYSLKAQTTEFDINPNSHDVEFNADEITEATSYVHNNTAQTLTLRWQRIVDSETSGWTTTVCDLNNCYSGTTSSMQFDLGAGLDGLLKLNLNAASIPGYSSYRLLVYDVNDSANTAAIETVVATALDPNGINDPETGIISMYPNPAKDILNIKVNANLGTTKIEIYNVVGQKAKVLFMDNGIKSMSIPVSDLKRGMYFIRLYNNDKVMVTKSFSKE